MVRLLIRVVRLSVHLAAAPKKNITSDQLYSQAASNWGRLFLCYVWPMLLPGLALILFFQSLPAVDLLTEEDARVADVSRLTAALKHNDPSVRRIGVRALGRLERPENSSSVRPLLKDPDPTVRAAAYLAFIHLKVDPGLKSLLEEEQAPPVRAQMLEALGRLDASSEGWLQPALETGSVEKTGALRGLEALVRLNRDKTLAESALRSLVRISRQDALALNRRLALTILLAVGKRESVNLEVSLSDEDPQVRRLAVRRLGKYRNDPSYLVRFEGLRVSENCQSAAGLTSDPSPHVRILAVRLLAKGCDLELLEQVAGATADPLKSAHALVALAEASPGRAGSLLSNLQAHGHWRVRSLVAEASVRLQDHALRRLFLNDPHPNVVAAALLEPEEALTALRTNDYGLLMKALGMLEAIEPGPMVVSALKELWSRTTAQKRQTSRDPRRLILQRLSEFDPSALEDLEPPVVEDFDPVIAAFDERRSGANPSPSEVRDLNRRLSRDEAREASRFRGARARFRMTSGEFWLDLLAEEAPVTVLRFVQRARKGDLNGLTFHRIEPNFVIQGISPGANEFVGTNHYTRDELSSLSHLRGTVGISTRGRDTGDGQIFVNLVDNYRLDHNYTIFSRVSSGMDVVDQIVETDTILAVEIFPK